MFFFFFKFFLGLRGCRGGRFMDFYGGFGDLYGGVRDYSAELRSFLLTICMFAPESTTNSPSSSFIVDAAGKTHSPEGAQNVAFSVSLSFKIFLASFHASPRAHRSCLSISA